ncbi:MAG TPA: S8 family peptidase [Gammaproteobacteria bacterium]
MEEKHLTPEQINRLAAENIAGMNILNMEGMPAQQQSLETQRLVKRRPPQYSGAIIVRLSSELPPAGKKCKTLTEMAKEQRLHGLEKVLDEYDLSISTPLIKSMDPDKVLALEKQAAKSQFPPLRSLTSYWRIDARNKSDKIEEILKRLNSLYEVDKASLELSATDPLVNAADDPYNATQDYLDAAPEGIDARWAWTQLNGEGAGIGFVDLEQGWFTGHEDYVSKTPSLVYGDNRDGVGVYQGNHGAAVLGEVAADDNTLGVVGIAPSLASVRMVSHYDSATNTTGHVADGILAVLPSMTVGDVLLLEIQRNFLPTETEDADFDAIRLAVAHGMLVVEASGNGNADLDAYTDVFGDTIFNRASPDFRDSGAIMIGACQSTLPHNRAWFSNYGTRIDCFAWGENVTSCGYGDLDAGTGDNSSYTDTFGGTSSASPIISGAALILQGMHFSNTGTRISPTQMRGMLSDPATGTLQGGGVAGNIGVMPNLQAIINNTLQIVPDIYVRDNIGDSGVVPVVGGISASPDIIARPVTVADPQAAFGQGSGTENSNTLGYAVEAGQDNYIYVRMKNRGGSDANDVSASVYWSEVSTLVTPDMWHLIGTTPALNVPQGDTLVVANPVTWSSAEIPATGHYCFVGVLDHPGDPAPPLPAATDWTGFTNFIRNQNNVTWRNFNVVDLDPSVGDTFALPFQIAGAPDHARLFGLEIMQHIPREIKVWLELPLMMAKPFMNGKNLEHKIDRKKGIIKLRLPTMPSIKVPGVKLSKSARIKAKFVIEGNKKQQVQPGNRIAIRQLHDGMEVGRVTWQFHNRKTQKCEV